MCGASARYMFSTILEEQIDFVVPPSIVHRDSIVWNVLSVHYDDNNIQSVKSCCKMAEKVDTLHRMDINALSVQSIPNFKGGVFVLLTKLIFIGILSHTTPQAATLKSYHVYINIITSESDPRSYEGT